MSGSDSEDKKEKRQRQRAWMWAFLGIDLPPKSLETTSAAPPTPPPGGGVLLETSDPPLGPAFVPGHDLTLEDGPAASHVGDNVLEHADYDATSDTGGLGPAPVFQLHEALGEGPAASYAGKIDSGYAGSDRAPNTGGFGPAPVFQLHEGPGETPTAPQVGKPQANDAGTTAPNVRPQRATTQTTSTTSIFSGPPGSPGPRGQGAQTAPQASFAPAPATASDAAPKARKRRGAINKGWDPPGTNGSVNNPLTDKSKLTKEAAEARDTVDFSKLGGGRVIGSGAFGTARWLTGTPKPLVIETPSKQGPGGVDPRQLLLQEVENYKAAGDHPNIPKCFGMAEVCGHEGLILEGIHGKTMRNVNEEMSEIEWLSQEPFIDILQYRMLEIVDKIDDLVQAGVAHNDINPDNIVIESSSGGSN